MNELLRLARSFRCDADDPDQVFVHRIRIGVLITALILLTSILG